MPTPQTAASSFREASDAELVSRCAGGDERAWDALVQRHSPLVFTIARRAGLDQTGAEDVTQTVFLSLFRELGSMRDGQSVSKWLIVVGRRQALKERQRQARAGTPDGAGAAGAIAPSEPDGPEAWERRAAVREAVRVLGGRCRDLLAALFLGADQPDYDHVAERLGMPRGSIGPTRARCLAKLLELMRERFPDLLSEATAPAVSGAPHQGTSSRRTH